MRDGEFVSDSVSHRIISGAIRYSRIHPDLWEDRLQRVAATGLNTVETYVARTFHERVRGEIGFSGPHDLARFIVIAGDLGDG